MLCRISWISSLVQILLCVSLKKLNALVLSPPFTAPFSVRTRSRPRIGLSSLYLSASYNNPNDEETPEERRARMEMVRKIQANFYSNCDDSVDQDFQSAWLLADPLDPTILRNLPLWRVQWTELPGFQNVLNVHVPHYTHMFRKLILQHPKPWYFGHVYLPGGSENLGNPDYFFSANTILYADDFLQQQDVKTVGTLMQVTDYLEQDDGRLTLIVQGVGRMKVLEASQQVPYAIASKAQLLSDQECWEQYVDANVGTPMDFELSMALIESAKAASSKQSELWRNVEFYQTSFETKMKDERVVMEGEGVSPLSNVNGTVPVDVSEIEEKLKETFSRRLASKADEYGSDEVLLAGTSMTLPGRETTESARESQVREWERKVWLGLDEMIRLLATAEPGLNIPVPTQLLGLLPTDVDWPEGFQMEDYAHQLEKKQARIGTSSKSPFVWLSKVYPEFPPMLRASRLSYAIWVILESVVAVDASRQDLLEIRALSERLKVVVRQLETFNGIVRGLIGDSGINSQ